MSIGWNLPEILMAGGASPISTMIGNTDRFSMRTTHTITLSNSANKTMKKKTNTTEALPKCETEIKEFKGFDPTSESSPLYDEYLRMKEEGYSDKCIHATLNKESIKLAWDVYYALQYSPVIFVQKDSDCEGDDCVYYKNSSGDYGIIGKFGDEMDKTDIYYLKMLSEIELPEN
jgi:hypothetical protein